MNMIPLRSEVCLLLMRAGGRMGVGFDQRFAEDHLTQAQFRFLLAVWTEGGETGVAPSVVADYLLIERATVSALEERLHERGFLRRLPGENRRSHRLALTQTGGQALAELGAKATELGKETLSVFDDDELATLHGLLTKLEQRLREMAARRLNSASAASLEKEKTN